MTLSEINARLLATGYPVAYSHFLEPQQAPFICYMQTDSDNFAADNTMYHSTAGITIELYTDKKDLIAEAKVKDALTGIYYDTHETFIDAEKLYQIAFEIEV